MPGFELPRILYLCLKRTINCYTILQIAMNDDILRQILPGKLPMGSSFPSSRAPASIGEAGVNAFGAPGAAVPQARFGLKMSQAIQTMGMA